MELNIVSAVVSKILRPTLSVGKRIQEDPVQRRNTARRSQSNMVEAIVGQDGRRIRVCCCRNGIGQTRKWILQVGHGQGKD